MRTMSEAGLPTLPLLLCQPPLCLHLYFHLALVLVSVPSSLLRLAGAVSEPLLLLEGRGIGLTLVQQDLACAILTLPWALFLRRPIRAVFKVGGYLLEGLGVADAVDVVLSTDP